MKIFCVNCGTKLADGVCPQCSTLEDSSSINNNSSIAIDGLNLDDYLDGKKITFFFP